jgi:ubiquinone/menaquinone biosynthesis C-methylase UbiE
MTQREYGGFMTQRQQQGNRTLSRFWSFFAPAYDFRYLQRWIYLPAQDEMIALLNTMESLRVVADIGCGTGILADRIEHETQATEVYGVDLSTGMLTQARARSAQVNWLTGSAERLPFDDGALDAVVTTTAFQFFDQPAALGEFHRVLAPGGLAAVAALSPPQRLPLRGLVASRVNIGPHHPRPTEMQTLFEDAGFTIREQHRVHRPTWTRFFTDVITVGSKPGTPHDDKGR